MPKAKNTPQLKPWYKNSNNWAWIVTGLSPFGVVGLAFDDARTDAFFFHLAHQPGFGDVVLCVDFGL